MASPLGSFERILTKNLVDLVSVYSSKTLLSACLIFPLEMTPVHNTSIGFHFFLSSILNASKLSSYKFNIMVFCVPSKAFSAGI